MTNGARRLGNASTDGLLAANSLGDHPANTRHPRAAMATAYLFNLPYHGHLNPCGPLIEALARRGERIIAYAPDEFRSLIEGAGGVFRPFNHQEDQRGLGVAVLGEWQARITEQCMDALVADALVDRPDYLLVDNSCLWGRCLAAHLRLPVAYIYSTFPLPLSYRRAVSVTLKELRKSAVARVAFTRFVRADRRLARRWKVPRVGLPFNVLCPRRGDLHLVLTGRELASNGSGAHSRYVFVGPCVRRPKQIQGDPLPRLDGRPLVYVSLGTVWNQRADFFRTCVEAYKDVDFQVLIAHAGGASIDALGNLPPHIHLCRYIDQIEVLQRAAAFVTHGGMNSVCEAAIAGVPMLVFPLAVDQFALAKDVAGHHAGIAMSATEVSAPELRAATERVIADATLRAGSRALGKKLRANGGPERAARLIMNLSASSGRAHVSSQLLVRRGVER
jgi:MGT family glycosyltransferase